MNDAERGTLNIGEPHPCALDAMNYVRSLGMHELSMAMEAYASCAIEGNRLAEICCETLRRLMAGEPVSDRYLLGLAWNLKTMQDDKRER